jgi:hypothetical protein
MKGERSAVSAPFWLASLYYNSPVQAELEPNNRFANVIRVSASGCMKTIQKLCGYTCVWFTNFRCYFGHKKSYIKPYTKIQHEFHVRNYCDKSKLSSMKHDVVGLRGGRKDITALFYNLGTRWL